MQRNLLIPLIVIVVVILVGCKDSSPQIDSSAVQIDSAAKGKKGAMENDNGLRN